MFSYWFMTAFSIIGMDWQADSVTSWLTNSGDGARHTWDTNGFVVNCTNLAPLWYLPLQIKCHEPSAWDPAPDSPLATWVVFALPRFPWLEMKDTGVHLLPKFSMQQAASQLVPRDPTSWCPHGTHSRPVRKDQGPAHSHGVSWEYSPPHWYLHCTLVRPWPEGPRQAVPTLLAHGNCEVWAFTVLSC